MTFDDYMGLEVGHVLRAHMTMRGAFVRGDVKVVLNMHAHPNTALYPVIYYENMYGQLCSMPVLMCYVYFDVLFKLGTQ